MLVGEVDETLVDEIRGSSAQQIGSPPPSASVRRASSLGELGYARLAAGEPSHPAIVAAVYLRPPAIGPQTGR
jgi:hypothetical protein